MNAQLLKISQISKIHISFVAACALSFFSLNAWGQILALEETGMMLSAARAPDQVKVKSKVVKYTTPVKLILEEITALKTASRLSGDQIYINVTEYSSVDKPTMHRVPEYPSHWLSKFSNKIKNVTIWEKSVQEGESVELIISLIESDAPPWDVDDLIGSVKLKLYIEKGKLEQEWSIPNKSIVKNEAEKDHFILTGDGAEYKISLEVKLDKKSDKKLDNKTHAN